MSQMTALNQVSTLNVPTDLIEYVARHKKEKHFALFLSLKFRYREGKCRLSEIDLQELAKSRNYKHSKSVRRKIQELIDMKWIMQNDKNGYLLLKSLNALKADYDLSRSRSIKIDEPQSQDIQATIGYVLYGILYKNQRRRTCKHGGVRLQGSTYNSMHSSFYLATISHKAISEVFSISQSRAYRFKKSALDAGLIHVQKNWIKITSDPAGQNAIKEYTNYSGLLISRRDGIFKQGIDLIAVDISFSKRK